MELLMIHQSFPGQFTHLLTALLKRGDTVTTLTPRKAPPNLAKGVTWHTYNWSRGNGQNVHPLARDLETKMIRAEALAQQAQALKRQGYRPDLIVGHPGWGEMLLLSEVWPGVPQLHYLEFFFGVPGTDTDVVDDYAPEQTLAHRSALQARNAALLMGMNAMSKGLSPTHFQRSLLPPWAMLKTEVIHEGIDTQWLAANRKTTLRIGERILRAGDPVITFVNRTFEPYRGIHVFLRALGIAQQQNRELQAILVGKNTPIVSYGKNRTDGRGWLTALRQELGSSLDWNRIYVLGKVPHATLRAVYQISAAHVYLSYPFVLSWSVLEAMSCGCLLIGSDTAPVREVVKHNETGWLVPFQEHELLAQRLQLAVADQASPDLLRLRRAARELIVQQYDQPTCIAKQLALVDALA